MQVLSGRCPGTVTWPALGPRVPSSLEAILLMAKTKAAVVTSSAVKFQKGHLVLLRPRQMPIWQRSCIICTSCERLRTANTDTILQLCHKSIILPISNQVWTRESASMLKTPEKKCPPCVGFVYLCWKHFFFWDVKETLSGALKTAWQREIY